MNHSGSIGIHASLTGTSRNMVTVNPDLIVTGTYRTDSPAEMLHPGSPSYTTLLLSIVTGPENSPSVWRSFHNLQIPFISSYIAGVFIGRFVYLRGLSALVIVPPFLAINCLLSVQNLR